jgi:hypothetical protein
VVFLIWAFYDCRYSKVIAIFISWWGEVAFLFRWEVPYKRREPSPLARLHLPFSLTTSRMQEDGSEIPPWTAEYLDRKDLFSMWRSITHALISTRHVAELHQELVIHLYQDMVGTDA